MYTITKPLVTLVFTFLSTIGTANAVLITQQQELLEDGQSFTFDFTGLAPSDGSGGTLTMSPDTLNDAFLGFDLEGSDEFMDVFIEDTNMGRFECITANDGGTLIPGSTGTIDCDFSLVLSITGADLATFLSDSILSVFVDFGSQVNAFRGTDRDVIILELTYEEAVSAVSAPASLGFLLGGVGLLRLSQRRKMKLDVKVY